MSSVVIGLVLICLGTGAFALAPTFTAVIPVGLGVFLALQGRSAMKAPSPWKSASMLILSSVTMILTASAVPRLVRLLTGAELERPGDIFVVGTTAVLCLVHVTLSLRTLIRSRSEH
jgi:hypothetical protein